MNADLLEKHFARMGARIKTIRREPIRNHWRWPSQFPEGGFSVDIQRDRRGEFFVFQVSTEMEDRLVTEVLQVQPRDRHLLMLVKSPGEQGTSVKDRFLCGFDEREWFVAAVPGSVSTVSGAFESLKPAQVLDRQAQKKLNRKQANRRRNRAFLRQGEWFFVPVENGFVDEQWVLHQEPIARSGGKPHLVQYLYREGGRTVYVCPKFPNGVSQSEYQELLRSRPRAKGWGWQVRRINPRVLARGEVRHRDHKTIVLHQWHEVLMNRENQSRTMRQVAFID